MRYTKGNINGKDINIHKFENTWKEIYIKQEEKCKSWSARRCPGKAYLKIFHVTSHTRARRIF